MKALPSENPTKPLICDMAWSGEYRMRYLAARLIGQFDCFHRPLQLDPRAAWYKEWHHFCILSPEVQVIFNLNLCGDTRPASAGSDSLAHMILLVYEHSWNGDIERIPMRDTVVGSQRIDLRFGHNFVRFENDVFTLSAALQDYPIGFVLEARPTSLPMVIYNNTRIGDGMINWFVLPRLIVHGTITIGRRVYVLNEAAAYHDHNWGRWLWGQDFAWEWGFVLPRQDDVQWSIIFNRMTNRARNHIQELALSLWKGESLHRVFTPDEIIVRSSGYLSLSYPPKFPRIMALAAPEATTEVPAVLEISAKNGVDYLLCIFESRDAAQIVVPNDTDLDVTIINEVTGLMQLEGVVKGERIKMEGTAIFEFLT